MKKTLAIIALALFIGGISVPAIAASNNALTQITLNEDDPKKKEKKSDDKKAEKSKKATKSNGCAGEKKSDCSSKCGGDS
jgi:uncharacterized protein YxeA